MPDVADVPNLKDELHRKLQESRAAMLAKLDSLSEYDLRRPMTQPTAGGLRGGRPPGIIREWKTGSWRSQRTRVTHERRAWDSNPRAGSPLLAIFKTAAIGH